MGGVGSVGVWKTGEAKKKKKKKKKTGKNENEGKESSTQGTVGEKREAQRRKPRETDAETGDMNLR